MLHFNTSYVTVQRYFPDMFYKYQEISIHPMLRFNNIRRSNTNPITRFQYILCYGSTFWLLELELSYRNFNTSYVTVQLKKQ